MRKITFLFVALIPVLCNTISGQTGNYKSHTRSKHQLLFTSDNGTRLRFRFQSNDVIRVQWVKSGEDFFADDRYEMAVDHDTTGTFTIKEKRNDFLITTNSGLRIEVKKSSLQFSVYAPGRKATLLTEQDVQWRTDSIVAVFQPDTSEHFCGTGHRAFGWVESIDLKGKTVSSNYGESHFQVDDWGPQAVLTVPFYLSGKGYGIFLNSTFHHFFNFGENGRYEFGINTKGFPGRMDYYIIYGPDFKDILEKYTRHTGRPRLPQRSIFGLQLSDKGSPDNDGEQWWKDKITAHRKAGFPFDHIVNDNRWRAGSGAWSGSWFEWDSTRYPDPAEYKQWCDNNHVMVTLDLNRNNIASCKGWKQEYNMPGTEGVVNYPNSVPDYTNPEMRNWIWKMFWQETFDTSLRYPGDGLWIDETDDLYRISDSVICANGRSWAENENYYPFLIAKAIVGEGWDNENHNGPPGIGEKKRPYVWIRSACAGGQRYATYWTGDILCNCNWMRATIRAMQVSGLAGYPYFNHDAGGFRWPGPDVNLYVQWSMGLGSFTPIWRPHGIGRYKRWPLDRSKACQSAALKYGMMRYEMMPYIYTYARKAHKTGLPMARAMVIDYQHNPEAWKYDLQYLWGNEMLVAPVRSQGDTVKEIWLPPGQNWYDFRNDSLIAGDKIINYQVTFDQIPLFVKEGAVIPNYNYAKSTFDLDPSFLILHVYTGKDGSFELYEDDGVTEKFRTRDEYRITEINYSEQNKRFVISPAKGNFNGAVPERKYRIVFHGIKQPGTIKVNGKMLKMFGEGTPADEEGIYWDSDKQQMTVVTGVYDVKSKVVVKKNKTDGLTHRFNASKIIISKL